MSGLIEGNNPFQAVFFPRDDQEAYLRAVRQKAEAESTRRGPIVVFEGNASAELRNNPLLKTQAAHAPAAQETRCTSGWAKPTPSKARPKPSSRRQAGSNLLVVGQRGDAALAMCCAAMLCLAATAAGKLPHPHSGRHGA